MNKTRSDVYIELSEMLEEYNKSHHYTRGEVTKKILEHVYLQNQLFYEQGYTEGWEKGRLNGHEDGYWEGFRSALNAGYLE